MPAGPTSITVAPGWSLMRRLPKRNDQVHSTMALSPSAPMRWASPLGLRGPCGLGVDLEVAGALEEVVEVGPDRLAALVGRVGRLVVDGVGGIGGGGPV